MECKVCGSKTKVMDTSSAPGVFVRLRECKRCGVQYSTDEKLDKVLVRNPETFEMESVPITQIEEYREYLMGRAPHPRFKNRRWNE